MRSTVLSLVLLASVVATLAKPSHDADPVPETEMRENTMDAPPMMMPGKDTPIMANPEAPGDAKRKGRFLWGLGYRPIYGGYYGGLYPYYPGYSSWYVGK